MVNIVPNGGPVGYVRDPKYTFFSQLLVDCLMSKMPGSSLSR